MQIFIKNCTILVLAILSIFVQKRQWQKCTKNQSVSRSVCTLKSSNENSVRYVPNSHWTISDIDQDLLRAELHKIADIDEDLLRVEVHKNSFLHQDLA